MQKNKEEDRHYTRFTLISEIYKTAGRSGKEAALLEELLLHKNSLLERKAILLKLWGDDSFFQVRVIDVSIARLRKYLVNDFSLSFTNIRGYGFKLGEE